MTDIDGAVERPTVEEARAKVKFLVINATWIAEDDRAAMATLLSRNAELERALAAMEPVIAAAEAEASRAAAAGDLRPPYQPYGVPPAAMATLGRFYMALKSRAAARVLTKES